MRSLFHYNEASFTSFPLLYWRGGRIYYINWKILMNYLGKKTPHHKISTITEPWIALQISSIPCVGDPSKQSIVGEPCLLSNLTVIGHRDYKSLTKKDVKLDRCGKPNCNCILVKWNALAEMWGICHGRKHFSLLVENQTRCLGRANSVNITVPLKYCMKSWQWPPICSMVISWYSLGFDFRGWVFCLTVHCCPSITPVGNLDNALEVHRDSASYKNSSSCTCAPLTKPETLPAPSSPSLSVQQVQMCECGGLWLGHSSLGTWKALLEFWVWRVISSWTQPLKPGRKSWLPSDLTLACQFEIRVVMQQLFILWTLWFGKEQGDSWALKKCAELQHFLRRE